MLIFANWPPTFSHINFGQIQNVYEPSEYHSRSQLNEPLVEQ